MHKLCDNYVKEYANLWSKICRYINLVSAFIFPCVVVGVTTCMGFVSNLGELFAFIAAIASIVSMGLCYLWECGTTARMRGDIKDRTLVDWSYLDKKEKYKNDTENKGVC